MAAHATEYAYAIAPAPTCRTRTAVPSGDALASASTATQLLAEDVVMGGTWAACSTRTPANSDFTFSIRYCTANGKGSTPATGRACITGLCQTIWPRMAMRGVDGVEEMPGR
ncbi:unnamed protein product [Zymoseptoria tritici ST99CH_3D7]|uniref:Uncharacterized protein n=1 Tax=Zymoseptoria tritici (strain ST99CH_3D7) TaxID=1276538 RepID=A0A1X7RDK0_ZYMT9|nr:unnamed protein product [Zymoseptoria tritici ST99CH_3D7]